MTPPRTPPDSPRRARAPRSLVALAVASLVAAGCGDRTDPRALEAYELVVAGKVDQAVGLANAVLADEPDNHQARMVLGLAKYKMGDPEGAIEQYRRTLQAKPDYAEAHFNLGNAYRMVGRSQEAEAAYAEAVRLQKKFVLAHYNLGDLYEDSGRIDQALAEYRRCVDYDPQFYFAHVNIGNILYREGDFEGAVQNLSRALELAPTAKELRVLLGNAYLQTGRADGVQLAEQEFRAAVGIDPRYLDAVYSLGVALATQGRNEEAAEWFRQVLQLAEGHPQKQALVGQANDFFERTGLPREAPGEDAASG